MIGLAAPIAAPSESAALQEKQPRAPGADAFGGRNEVVRLFDVRVTAGGPGVGTLQLTLLTPFVFPLPTEHVLNGQISIH
jgi:hypothetical protein